MSWGHSETGLSVAMNRIHIQHVSFCRIKVLKFPVVMHFTLVSCGTCIWIKNMFPILVKDMKRCREALDPNVELLNHISCIQ